MSGASAVQKQSLADALKNSCQACNFIKKRLPPIQVFSYEIYEIWKSTFTLVTPQNTSTLVAASGSKQRKPMKTYTSEREMIYLNGTSKVRVSRKRVFIWGFSDTLGSALF